MADTPRVTVPVEPTPDLTNEQIQSVMLEAVREVRATVTDHVEAACMDADIARMERGPVDMGPTGWRVMRAVHRRLAMLSAAPAPEGGAVTDALQKLRVLRDQARNGTAVTDPDEYDADELDAILSVIEPALAAREEAPANRAVGAKTEGVISRDGYWIDLNWIKFGSSRTRRLYDPLLTPLSPALADLLVYAFEEGRPVHPEAPAEAGEPAGWTDDETCEAAEKHGATIERNHLPDHYHDVISFTPPELRDFLSALRAQPQAREDAQPVADEVLPVAWVIRTKDGHIRMWTMSEARARTAAEAWGMEAKQEGLSPVTHPAPDALRAIEMLRASEGDSVTILCDNPEATDLDDAMAVVCCGPWTNWKDRRFYGRDVSDALSKALAALQAEQKGGA